jgi:hypothetical protein
MRIMRRHGLVVTPLLALAVGLASCDSSPTEAKGLTLAPVATVVGTFERVRVEVPGAQLMEPSYVGTLGPADVTAERTSDSTVVVQVPDLPAGSYLLQLEVGSRTVETTVIVESTPEVPDPAEYVAAADHSFAGQIDSVEAWYDRQAPSFALFLDRDGFLADVDMMRETLADLRTGFEALSPDGQREVAMMLRAYRARSGSPPSAGPSASLLDDPGHYPECESTVDNIMTAEEMRACRAQYLDTAAQQSKTVQQCDVDFNSRWQDGSHAMAIGINYIAYECAKARMLAFKKTVSEAIKATVFGFFSDDDGSFALTPSLALSAAEEMRATVPPGGGSLFFRPGEARAFTPELRFRNLMAEDVGRVPAATELAEHAEEVREGWNDLNSSFPRPFVQSPPWADQVTASYAVPLGYDLGDLRLGRIEPALIHGTAEVVDGEWMLTFTSEEAVIGSSFTFDVVYDGGEFGADTTTVQAEFADHPLVGLWDVELSLTVSGWTSGPDGTKYPYEFPCTGTTVWTGQVWESGSVRFGPDAPGFEMTCNEGYEGENPTWSVTYPWAFYGPDYLASWVEDGAIWDGSIEIESDSLFITEHWTLDAGRSRSSTLKARITGDRIEGTFFYAKPEGSDHEEATGTLVASRR